MSEKQSITVTVYGLSSSEDGELRYIGQTIMSLAKRLSCHIADARKRSNHRHHWINSVIAAGHQILISPLMKNAVLHEAEIETIAKYKALGYRLVNQTAGGEGTMGCVPTPEARKNISAAIKGKLKSKEHLANIGAAQRGKSRGPLSEATKAKLSIAGTGRMHSAESIKKMSAVQTGRTFSDTAIAKMSATRKGRLLPESHKENIAAALTRAYASGKRRSAQSKLTDEQVKDLRLLLALPGANQRTLAKQYGISEGSISALKNGTSYKFVK